ncbi:MAG: hypothetical protein ACYCWN_12745 [Ferrimicrobium sp.]|uniref:hypothetical protein n=1 Tax=Ferrimicrobium sp. TaxID=2926050 RepID=UPI0026293D0E|nr:hypothetical protein [Ferrimicrobium sp.]MCL5973766.1 hypothetical protein [Actinomycetota bacterium]
MLILATVVVVGAVLVVSDSQLHGAGTGAAAHPDSGPPKLEVTSASSFSTSSTALATPSNFTCEASLCIVATSDLSGQNYKLWVHHTGQAVFSRIPLPPGPAPFVGGLACRSLQTCYALVNPSPSGTKAALLVTDNAGLSWGRLNLGSHFRPASVGCLSDGACWVSGAAGGDPEVLVSIRQSIGWSPLRLPNEPSGAANQVSCATAANCIDVVALPSAMAESQEALRGSLVAGFTTILSPALTEPQDQASCDSTDCYFNQAFGQGTSRQIRITSIADNGTVSALAATKSPNTFIQRLTCSSARCMVIARTQKSTSSFWAVGSSIAPVQVPKGLNVDSPSLDCVNTSPTCLLTLGPPGLGLPSIYLTTLHRTRLQLGHPVQLPTNAKATFAPFDSQLVSCPAISCFETVETTGGLRLLSFHPGHHRVTDSFLIRDASAGVGLLAPIAMTCPSTTDCKVIVEIGNGPYQLLSLDPIHRSTAAVALPPGITPEALACSSSQDCVMGISGISHHDGFPVLWSTDAGRSWHSAHVMNVANDLSTMEVTCRPGGVCLAIGQHDFVDGYGSLRPFIAYSHDNGRVWHLFGLTGQVPYSLQEPALYSVACTSTGNCAGVVATSGATLLLQGGVSTHSWAVQTISLRPVGQNAPYSASLACGSIHCLLTLTINPGGPAPKLSVQSLVIGPGKRVSPIVSGQLPTSGDLAAVIGSHQYLDADPTGADWIHLTRV